MIGEKPDIVIGHMPCRDGLAAMWALHRRWPDLEFLPGDYGSAPDFDRLAGKNVLIVDFSYKRGVLENLGEVAYSITILDHHKSAQADLQAFMVDELLPVSVLTDTALGRQPVPGLPIQALFDMERSGAMLAWNYAHQGHKPPPLVEYVQDADLWRWALPQSQDISAYMSAFPLDIAAFDQLHGMLLADRDGRCAYTGSIVKMRNDTLAMEIIGHTARPMVIGGSTVVVANAWKAFASQVAGQIAEASSDGIGACYFDRSDGRREFSLRSRKGGVDVSVIAEGYGGGGHFAAAGFVAPCGWDGDGSGVVRLIEVSENHRAQIIAVGPGSVTTAMADEGPVIVVGDPMAPKIGIEG